MQAYISRSYVPVGTWEIGLECLPAVCAFCNEEVYSEYEPTDETVPWYVTTLGSSHVGYMPYPKYFHVRDNTPICDAKL